MVALDERSGELFARLESDSMRTKVLGGVSSLFQSAGSYNADLDGTASEEGALEKLLLENKLEYRIFTTTIALKESRWSF